MQTARTSHRAASFRIIGFAVSRSCRTIGSLVCFVFADAVFFLAADDFVLVFVLLLWLLFFEAADFLPAAEGFFAVLDAK